MQRAAELAPTFWSVNHEANPFRVLELQRSLQAYRSVDRRPHLMRPGYAAEVYSKLPPD